jgi:integrase
MFNYAEAAEMIGLSPCRHIRLPAVELVHRPALTIEELSAVAENLGEHGLMVWLGAVLGLRWGEAAGLCFGAIDFNRQEVRVEVQLGRDRRLSAPKSAAGRRTMAAPQWLLQALQELIDQRSLARGDTDALLFVNLSGGPLNYTAWWRERWVPAYSEAGLPNLRFHDLRSLAASAMVAEGVDVKTAQRRLGHANVALTLQVYARASAEADRRAADLIGERFRPRDGRGMIGRDVGPVGHG